MTRVVWSDEAKADLDEIWLYVAGDSIGRADRLIDALVDTTRPLEDYPLMGVDRSEFAPDLRALMTGSYVLFYRASPGRVRIERVVHGRRDIDASYF